MMPLTLKKKKNTLCFLPVRNDLNHFKVWSTNPNNSSFLHSRSISSVSKAADGSQMRIPVFCPASLLIIQSFCMCEWAVIVDLFLQNPCWLSGKSPLSSIKSVSWVQTIFSKTLEAVTRQLTGRLYLFNNFHQNIENKMSFTTVTTLLSIYLG